MSQQISSPATSEPHAPPTFWMPWQRLGRLVPIVQAGALLATAAALGDPEAAAVGAGFLVGFGLLHVGRGWPGRVLLAAMFTNVLGWMALATASSLGGGHGVGAVLLPGALTAVSALGLAATLVTFSRSARRSSRGTTATVSAAAALVVVLLGAALMSTPGRAADPGDAMEVTAAQLAFEPETLVAERGLVTVSLRNDDLFWHTLTIDELGIDLPAPVRSQRSTSFRAGPGSYSYYCRVPGHESLMTGTLEVR